MCELSVRIVPGDAKCVQYRQSGSDSCRDCADYSPVLAAVKPVEVVDMDDSKPKRLRKGDQFTCPEFRRENAVYESGGLCGVCAAKVRKAKRTAVAAADPMAGVSPSTKKKDGRPPKVKAVEKPDPNCTCPSCLKDYFAQGCNECPFCGHEHGEPALLSTGPVVKPSAVYPDLDADAADVSASFGKVTNTDGDVVPFGVDPMIHMALRDAWYDVERKALEALSGLAPASALVRAANLVQRIQALEA